jgi:hypothetical protein
MDNTTTPIVLDSMCIVIFVIGLASLINIARKKEGTTFEALDLRFRRKVSAKRTGSMTRPSLKPCQMARLADSVFQRHRHLPSLNQSSKREPTKDLKSNLSILRHLLLLEVTMMTYPWLTSLQSTTDRRYQWAVSMVGPPILLRFGPKALHYWYEMII